MCWGHSGCCAANMVTQRMPGEGMDWGVAFSGEKWLNTSSYIILKVELPGLTDWMKD